MTWRSRVRTSLVYLVSIVAGFTLADGRKITVLKNWRDDGVDGQFLRAIHARACRYFRVVLGPNYNELHRDHFHVDRGILSTCR